MKDQSKEIRKLFPEGSFRRLFWDEQLNMAKVLVITVDSALANRKDFRMQNDGIARMIYATKPKIHMPKMGATYILSQMFHMTCIIK